MTPLEAVQTARSKYGPSPTGDECGAIVNHAAYLLGGPWGVNAKPGGTNAPQPKTGIRIARDVLHNRDTNIIYDVLVAAGDGGEARPAFQELGPATDPSRPWVAPVAPEGVEPQPQPGDDTFEKEIVARLDVLGDQVFELGVAIEKLRQAMVAAGSRSYRGEAKILGMKTTFTLTPNA
jgi:hypothetical protein